MNTKFAFLATLMLTTAAGQAPTKNATPPASAPPAAAAKLPPLTTAGCLLVSNAFANSATEDKDRTIARAAVYFFMGRIENGTTGAQLKAAFAAQEKVINNANAAQVMNACLQLVQAKSDLLASISEERPQGR